jgi:hypothetical protein
MSNDDQLRYTLSLDGIEDSEREVTREEWVRAERHAGFYPKGGDRGQPATGGFFGHGVRGRIEARPLDLTDVIAQAAETDAQRPHYEVKRTSPVSSPRTGPGHTYTYRPKLGDVVIFPNGVEFNYSEHDEQVVAVAPRGKGLTSRYTADEGYLLLIGVE